MEACLLIGDFLILVGILLLICGLILIFADSSFSQRNFTLKHDQTGTSGYQDYGTGKPHVSGGGVIMLGPIPIVFGSDKRGAETAIKLAILLVILYIALLVFFR
jgi:uncharacterized protein (TIGR00304 family)